MEKCRKAHEHDFSLVHLALDHPQPPKHSQGHQTMWPWVSLQESHPTSLPTLNSQPRHFLTAFTAWGSRTRTELSLCPLPITITFCEVGSTKREAAGIKKIQGYGEKLQKPRGGDPSGQPEVSNKGLGRILDTGSAGACRHFQGGGLVHSCTSGVWGGGASLGTVLCRQPGLCT